MNPFARSRTIPGGVQLEMDVDTAREIVKLIHYADKGTEHATLTVKRVAQTLENTLEIPR